MLNIKNLLFEVNFTEYEGFLPLFAGQLVKFARFKGCVKIKIEKIYEPKIKKKLIVLTKKMI